MKKVLVNTIFCFFVPTGYANLSTNVALKTNYILRGITQTNQTPAIQGGFDYNAAIGIYIGTWASNVSWVGGTNSLEDDIYVGYKINCTKDLSLDIGTIGYLYPSTPINVNFAEGYAALTYKMITIKESYSPDYIHVGTYSFYSELNITYPLKITNHPLQDVSLLGHVGGYHFGNEIKAGLDNYLDWSIGLNKDFSKGFSVSVMYTANTLASNFYPFNKSTIIGGLSYRTS